MFGAVSNRDLENIDKYFQQLIDFLSYEKNEFEKKILPELKTKVIYQYKGYNKEMAEILEHLVAGKLEIVK